MYIEFEKKESNFSSDMNSSVQFIQTADNSLIYKRFIFFKFISI